LKRQAIIILNYPNFNTLSAWYMLITTQDDVLPEMLRVSIVIKRYRSQYCFLEYDPYVSQLLIELTIVFEAFRMIELGTRGNV